ncbi:MAG: trigger factor [Nitrospinae bacterium]|nr:trigger factor [Nitrospinota bacterium]
MKIELQDVESCVKKIIVEVPAERVNQEKTALFNELAREVTLPGFRKGKAPRKAIEKRYGKSILGDAAERLIQDAFRKAVEDNKLRTVGDPMVDNINIEENQPLTFTATVEVLPEITVKDVAGLAFTRKIAKVTDAEIDRILEGYRQRHARFEPVEGRAVREGDYPIIDFTSRHNGAPVPSLQGQNKQVTVNKEDMLEGVLSNLIGMNKGEEKTFTAALPKEFPDPELAGADLEFTVKVNEIKAKTLPELNDEFAQEISESETMEALRTLLRENLEERNRSMADNDLRAQIVSRLIADNTFDLPPRMVEKHAEHLAERANRRFAERGVDLSSGFDFEKFREKHLQDAATEIREQVILSTFARGVGVDVTAEDLEAGITRVAGMMGEPLQSVRERLMSHGGQGLERMAQNLLLEKAYDALKAKLTIEDTYIEETNEK